MGVTAVSQHRCASLRPPSHLLCSPDGPHLDFALTQPQRLQICNQGGRISCRLSGSCCWNVCLHSSVAFGAGCSRQFPLRASLGSFGLFCVLGTEGSWVSFLIPVLNPDRSLPLPVWRGNKRRLSSANCVTPGSLIANPTNLASVSAGGGCWDSYLTW